MRLLVVGAGGHAKVVIDAAERSGWIVAGIVDETGAVTRLRDQPVSADAHSIEVDAVVIAIGDNRLRAERLAHYEGRGLSAAAVIHPDAAVDASAIIGPGTVVFAGVVVNADARVGRNAILNTGCTVDHDCEIGDHAHIGPGANLCGGVVVGEGALVGVGACAVPSARIGDWATVGAGSAVIETIQAGSVCAGSPARPLRHAGGES